MQPNLPSLVDQEIASMQLSGKRITPQLFAVSRFEFEVSVKNSVILGFGKLLRAHLNRPSSAILTEKYPNPRLAGLLRSHPLLSMEHLKRNKNPLFPSDAIFNPSQTRSK